MLLVVGGFSASFCSPLFGAPFLGVWELKDFLLALVFGYDYPCLRWFGLVSSPLSSLLVHQHLLALVLCGLIVCFTLTVSLRLCCPHRSTTARQASSRPHRCQMGPGRVPPGRFGQSGAFRTLVRRLRCSTPILVSTRIGGSNGCPPCLWEVPPPPGC